MSVLSVHSEKQKCAAMLREQRATCPGNLFPNPSSEQVAGQDLSKAQEHTRQRRPALVPAYVLKP